MIDWQPMPAHFGDRDPVLVCFRCPVSGTLETQAAWYDDGTDANGEVVEEPCWYEFDQEATGPCEPLAWAPYPIPDEAAWAKLGNPQVSG